mgnify:CR=1 FL=1
MAGLVVVMGYSPLFAKQTGPQSRNTLACRRAEPCCAVLTIQSDRVALRTAPHRTAAAARSTEGHPAGLKLPLEGLEDSPLSPAARNFQPLVSSRGSAPGVAPSGACVRRIRACTPLLHAPCCGAAGAAARAHM